MSTLGFCNLGVNYDGVPAVVDFNDILYSGEWLCLIGPNGAGKSSVLRAAAGLVSYSGSVAIDQNEIPATSARWRARLLMAWQWGALALAARLRGRVVSAQMAWGWAAYAGRWHPSLLAGRA